MLQGAHPVGEPEKLAASLSRLRPVAGVEGLLQLCLLASDLLSGRSARRNVGCRHLCVLGGTVGLAQLGVEAGPGLLDLGGGIQCHRRHALVRFLLGGCRPIVGHHGGSHLLRRDRSKASASRVA